MGSRGFKCVKCGRYQAGERGGLCLDCEQELKDEQRKRQARLTRFYHTWERRWKALEKVKRAGGAAWIELRKIARQMEPYSFFKFFGRRRRWQCFECLKEGTKFVAEMKESVEEAAKRNEMTWVKIKDQSFLICNGCAEAIVNENIAVKTAARSGTYASHVYLPASQIGRRVIAILR